MSSRSKCPWRRKNSPGGTVLISRGELQAIVPAGQCLDAARGRAVEDAVRQLLKAGRKEAITVGLDSVREVSPAAWTRILMASAECRRAGVGMRCEGMTLAVQQELGRVWDVLAVEIERRMRRAGSGPSDFMES